MAHPIVMPSVGMFTSEGYLTSWLRPAGARVAAGEPIAEVTTEKTTQELVAPAEGVLHPVAQLGATLAIQGLLGYILGDGEAPPAVPPGVGAPGASAGPAAGAGPPSPQAGDGGRSPGDIRASPVARRLAAEQGVDLSRLVGTGPGGRIVEADVLAAAAQQRTPSATSPAPRRVRQTIPFSGVRRTIADRLRASLATTAAVTLTREVDATVLVAARAALRERLGAPVAYDALFVKILAMALRDHMELNAVIEGDAILVLDEIHVGVAVAVPGGLLVPVVRAADGRSLADIASTVRDLTSRALTGQLRPEDVSEGTVTLTNLGGYGVDAFTPILNPPQSAILGIGRIRRRPMVYEDGLTARDTCPLSLTFDHRVVDGATAAGLLGRIADLMAAEGFMRGLA